MKSERPNTYVKKLPNGRYVVVNPFKPPFERSGTRYPIFAFDGYESEAAAWQECAAWMDDPKGWWQAQKRMRGASGCG